MRVLIIPFTLCACTRMYGASSRELGERHASCDILPSVATAAAAASASTYRRRRRCCCCCLVSWIFESRSPGGGKQSLRNEMGQPVECSLLDLQSRGSNLPGVEIWPFFRLPLACQ